MGQERQLPLYMSPFTPDQFKYSFTVKYIGLLRQVFSPFQSLNYAFENLLQWVYRATRLRCRLDSELRRGMVRSEERRVGKEC